ncbi:BMP family ABC transporter substrate-binding protein [Compostimonas suwonensis]|uniref:Basic membrane protein n=1 Tax=Compostimonas suwonensis TaxID=1048394 RepID=A0A2M9C432_9MICO|nr:BMP family ABC transporter substrate-binding protein [Compostimonas suwonensis]PJJ65272.1 basic membrane protein [Compostimonas suwonensis]
MTSTPATPRESRRRPRRAALLLATAAAVSAVALLTGCAASAPQVGPNTTTAPDAAADVPRDAAPQGLKPLGPGFLGSVTTPSPEATITPEVGSWDGVTPPPGYRVILLSAGDDAATATLVTAVTNWARSTGVDLQAMTASNDDGIEADIEKAVELEPDLVVSAGDKMIDVLMLLSSQHLNQQFLVVGSELPEPTGNVTSVTWPGATFRGTGLGAADQPDPAAITPERAAAAVPAGVASVLHGLTGIVVRLE